MKFLSIGFARFLIASSVCLSVVAEAQAPVNDVSTSRRRVEVSDGFGTSATAYGAAEPAEASSPETADSGSMFRQFQQLQQEVEALRGQVEEQSYQLKKLKQQHDDDFASLDHRLSGGSSVPATSGSNALQGDSSAASAADTAAPVRMPAGNMDGKDEYEAAYAKLKGKDNAGAKQAFRAFVDKYPDSDFAGNSWFWLGFVYQMDGDIDASANAFSTMIDRFPGHAKVDDAKYNLGKIYHQQGKTEQARSLLKDVASGNSKSAPLAKAYLDSM